MIIFCSSSLEALCIDWEEVAKVKAIPENVKIIQGIF